MELENILTLVLIGGFTLLVFGVCGWVIKQHWLDKQWISDSTRFIGRSIYTDLQNADAQDAMEEVIYQEEEEREEDFGGEKPKPGGEEVEIDYKDSDNR